jgi:hypothetical protein
MGGGGGAEKMYFLFERSLATVVINLLGFKSR